jgi:hypothetical protein
MGQIPTWCFRQTTAAGCHNATTPEPDLHPYEAWSICFWSRKHETSIGTNSISIRSTSLLKPTKTPICRDWIVNQNYLFTDMEQCHFQ